MSSVLPRWLGANCQTNPTKFQSAQTELGRQLQIIVHFYQQEANLCDVHLDRVSFAVEEEVHMELRVAARPDPLVDEDAHVLAGHHEYGVLEEKQGDAMRPKLVSPSLIV